MSADEFVFNWHDEPEGFKKWLIPTLLGDVIRDDAVLAELEAQSDHWQRTELRVEVNGHVIDAERFLEVLESTIKWEASDAAARRVGRIAELRVLRDAIDGITEQLYERVYRIAHEHGLELRES